MTGPGRLRFALPFPRDIYRFKLNCQSFHSLRKENKSLAGCLAHFHTIPLKRRLPIAKVHEKKHSALSIAAANEIYFAFLIFSLCFVCITSISSLQPIRAPITTRRLPTLKLGT
jgi:hypothetical protein